jgi:hypothetical protein
MKKFISIIFFLAYFVSSTGATIQLHYCMNKLVSSSLSGKEKPECGKCGMEKKGHKGCCHDENKFLKIEKNHEASVLSFDFTKLLSSHFKPIGFSEAHIYILKPSITPTSNHAPPGARNVPLYLSNSVFRI